MKMEIKLWRQMMRIRIIELKIAEKYHEREMRCPVHLSVGQECVPVCISANLTSIDKAFSAHRAHAHYLAKGGSLPAMIAELYGKASGCTGGRGGSMHLMDVAAGFMAAVPIVGSSIPIAVGAAWAKSLQRKSGIVVAYLGEGATEEGVFSESLDFASLHKLPILFVVENNFYSIYTHLKFRQSHDRSIKDIARAHGVKAFGGSDVDPLQVFKKCSDAIAMVRDKQGPCLLEFDTHRWLEHCGPNNDDHLEYRDLKELLLVKTQDPIKNLESFLIEGGLLTKDNIRDYEMEIIDEIDDAFLYAKNSEFPKATELFKFLYSQNNAY